jgi:hypothetical protein
MPPRHGYRPATDAEWAYLTRRFSGLHGGRMDERGRMIERSSAELRRLFNEGLSFSPVSEAERIRARTIVRERVRARSVEAFPDPYFELEWTRTVAAHPELGEWPTSNDARATLWDAYYRRSGEAEEQRTQAQKEWHAITTERERTGDVVYEDT